MLHARRNWALGAFGVATVVAALLIPYLRFSFDFEQFFPQGDPDYAFFKEFIDEFESDDNFLLIAVSREQGVFDSAFLHKAHAFALETARLPHVNSSASLTKLSYPLRTPFGITSVPVIHIDDPARYAADSARVMSDPRFVNNLISGDGTALNVLLKTVNQSSLEQAQALMDSLDHLLRRYDFESARVLGRARFQRDLVWMQKREIAVSTVISALFASIALFFFFRRGLTVLIAMTGIGLALLLFMGLLSALGRELNALSGLYPVLICIVGVADVIHLLTKYVDELGRGKSREEAFRITLRDVGLATFITSTTTAIGLASLMTSRTMPIQSFGLNAALGVIFTYFVVLAWLWALLPRFDADRLVRGGREYAAIDRFTDWIYRFTLSKPKQIMWGMAALILICSIGAAQITTNYRITNNLPRGQDITKDFLFFEKKFAGFRPVEFAVLPQNGYRAKDFEVLREMDKLERRLRAEPAIRSVLSVNDLYRSLNAMYYGNKTEAYRLPDSLYEFERLQPLAERLSGVSPEVLISRDGDKARIAARMLDVGRDTVAAIEERLNRWIVQHSDSSVAQFRITGTGIVLDKNSRYIRDNMLQGLGLSVLAVGLIMLFLFRDWRVIAVFYVPNILPLFIAAGLIGYFGIPLEAGIATIFSIIFGIATDDTIHFLSAFKINRAHNADLEHTLRTTLRETGKAMTLSSIVLFFSFLVMLFSINPPSVIVGALISVTLAAALFCDLLLAPILARIFKI